MRKEKDMKYQKAIERLIEGIKADYANWSSWPEGIERFNDGVRVKSGKKYDKVIQGSSVWGFIAKADGVLKGIPFKRGDVFKAAGWSAPAKWQRGNIFDSNQNYFRWTGPDYLI
jgi:hypothetical protein|tara:strand:+ start:149 stop:490 length:342 start_codon:yes stop_codon:yes gene_type:complete